jgi:hypothetical protein
MRVHNPINSIVSSVVHNRRGKLSEAQLFGAVMLEKVAGHTSAENLAEYKKGFRQAKKQIRESTGERGVVEAALTSLKNLVKNGKISADCAKVIRNEAWTLSQLDQDSSKISTRKDSKQAVVCKSEGVERYMELNAKYEKGEIELYDFSKVADLSKGPKVEIANKLVDYKGGVGSVEQVQGARQDFGSSPIYQKGFLFKPFSDSTGKLAILTPPSLTGQVKSVAVVGNGAVENGSYGGVGNGYREHFRFNRSGPAYGENAVVLVTLRDNSQHRVVIPNPSLRYEVK